MSNSLWAYAKLGFNPGVQVLDVAARRVMLSLHQYNSQELANMLFSFATLEHHPGLQLLETAALQIATRLDQFSPQVAVACCPPLLALWDGSVSTASCSSGPTNQLPP